MHDLSTASRIDSIASLRKRIAEPPALMKKRLQPRIDAHCASIIERASVCAVGFFAAPLAIHYLNLRASPVLHAEGDTLVLSWPADTQLPEPLKHGNSLACSLFFIMPGIGFALRANGHCRMQHSLSGSQLVFGAQAFFLHCSRAAVRAQLWTPRAAPSEPLAASGQRELSDEALAFIERVPYLLMLTRNAQGATELSPRGDPEGFVLAADRRTLLLPERPGNKVAGSLLNVMATGEIALSLLVPGNCSALAIRAQAWLTDDRQWLEPLAIGNKVPTLATVVQVNDWCFQSSQTLVDAGLWQPETYVAEDSLASFPKMLAEHMNGTGLLGKATTLVVDAVVKHDLKHLY